MPRPTSVLFDVLVLSRRVAALLGVALDGAPLTPAEYATYSAVFEFGPLSASALARHLGLPVTSVHDDVRRLIDRGHVERARDRRDRRSWLLRLTAEGTAAHRATAAYFQGAVEAIEHRLDTPVDDLRAGLIELTAACEGAARDLTFDAQGDVG